MVQPSVYLSKSKKFKSFSFVLILCLTTILIGIYSYIYFSSLNGQVDYAYLAFAFIYLLVLVVVALSAIYINLSLEEGDHREFVIKSISDTYLAMYQLDMFDGTIRTIKKREVLADENIDFPINSYKHWLMMTAMQSQEQMQLFMDLETIDERLSDADMITQDFLSKEYGWCRAKFIVVNRNEDNKVHHLLLIIEHIDEEVMKQNRLIYLSETDIMTGIYNRGSGEKKIRRLMEQGVEGMFCLFDIDRFKSINDTYGHIVGDQAIIGIADCMKRVFRDKDILMRLGGDEFVVYVQGVDTMQTGYKIIERLFNNVQAMHIRDLDKRGVNISMGVCFYKLSDNLDFNEVYRRADEATYKSKEIAGCYVTFYGVNNDKEGQK